jgi:hypothetical protein
MLSIALAFLLAGCAVQNVKLNNGPEKSASELGTISSLGLYPEIKLSLMVTEINGQTVNTTRTASFLVVPGTYRLKIHAMNNLSVGSSPTGQGIGVSYNTADKEITLEVKANHTYIPSSFINKDVFNFTFDDKGENFPQACLPLYQFTDPKKCNLKNRVL